MTDLEKKKHFGPQGREGGRSMTVRISLGKVPEQHRQKGGRGQEKARGARDMGSAEG